MDNWLRLFGHLHLQHRNNRKVEHLRIRVQTKTRPDAKIKITDIQAQPGDKITGWVFGVDSYGLAPVSGWELRNGVFAGPQTLVVPANTDQASPVRVDVEPLAGGGPVNIEGYQYGEINQSATVNGFTHTATQGAGTPPHLTRRSDVDYQLSQQKNTRSRVLIWFRGITPIPDTTPQPPPGEKQDHP